MIKRTNGYLLLLMLVLTGLAGRIHSDSLSGKERRLLNNNLKESKSVLLKSVSNLSEAQLNFKPAPDQWSIKECIVHIALTEKMLWDMATTAMKGPSTPEKRADVKFKDEEILKTMSDRSNKVKTFPALEPQNATFTSTEAALSDFKANRQNLLRYVKTTTEDLRNHMTNLSFGTIDVYQLLLGISAHTTRHTQQIQEIKADPAFPK